MIKAFLFDYDGVMTAGPEGNALSSQLARNLNVSEEHATEWLNLKWRDYAKGLATEEELWAAVEEKYGRPITTVQRDIWFKWENLQPQPEMLALVEEIKAQGYKVGVLSNVTPATAATIRSHGGYDVFEFEILSCNTHTAKPEPEIYLTAMKALDGILPTEVVFLDDRPTSLIPAEELGMKTILVTSARQAIGHVETLLNL